MILLRLGSLCARKSKLSQRFLLRTGRLNFSSKSDDKSEKPIKLIEDDKNDEPVAYSKTKAYKHLAKHTFQPESVWPEYQPLVIALSLTIFLIYFCVLREENDIDESLDTPLEVTFKRIEEAKRIRNMNNEGK